MGDRRVVDIRARELRSFLVDRVADPDIRFSRGSGRHALATARVIFAEARALELIHDNPASGLGRAFGKATADDEVAALDANQLRSFLATVTSLADEGERLGMFLMAWCGLRVREALGVTWDRVDWSGSKIRIDRQLGIPTTKSGRTRNVATPRALVERLEHLRSRRAEEALACGRRLEGSELVVYPDLDVDHATRQQYETVRKRLSRLMARALHKAGLPERHTPHDLRHTYGSLHSASGCSAKWLQQQMGHHSISVTMDVYGRWFPVRQDGRADQLAAATSPDVPQDPENVQSFPAKSLRKKS